ncbi:trichohyalin-like isoform X5 [Acipenser ruthenus]|uniref:trichohyalin-like isoform X5 n=1 Tax=Acipenser ruthenus TaxID=7906 RepID=UPI0027403577|nr:trichohyalin-like isoform X5 [Acipenser ruthenus]
MADRKKSRRMGSTRKGQRRLQNPKCRLGDEEGPLEDVMEKSGEKAQETPGDLHKIQEVHGERGISTQGGRQKLLVDPPVSVGELEQGLGWEGSGFITSKDLPSRLREFVEVQPSPSVKERGEERLAPSPMLSQPQSTEPPRGAEDEENAMVHRKRKLGSTRKGQRRMHVSEGQLVGEEGPPGGVMEESEEKVQESNDPLHKIQEIHGERGFSTQGDSQKEELDNRLKTEVASQNISPPPREFVEVQPSPSVKETGEEEERVIPAPMFSQPESTEPPRGAEDEDNAMVHRKRKLGSTRKGQRRMQILEGQLVGEEGPPGGVMEESEEKLQETPDELHKIQEVQEERGFSTHGDSQKAEGPLENVMEESEEKVLETPDELHKIQEVHGERGFSTQGDSQKEEGPLEDVMEETEEKLQETPDELHKIQEVHGERGFSTQEDRQKEDGPLEDVMEKSEEKVQETPDPFHKIQEVHGERGFSTQEDSEKEELDHRLKMEVASQNISPPPWEFVEAQPSASVKEKGEEEERVSPAPMFSQPESTKPPRGAEDEDNAMVHIKRKLGSTRKGQRRMHVSEGQLVGEEGPPGGVMEESEEKLQETPDELHKIQEVQGERGFSTQGDSQKAEGPLEYVMEESEEKVLETLDELHKIQEVHGERGFTTQGDSEKEEGPLEDVMEETEEKLQETPDELHKIQEVHGERGFSTQEDRQKEDGPLEDVMEKSEEKVQETPDPFHKIQEVHGERGFSTQEDSEKEELDHRLKMEVASQNISPPPWEFVEAQPSASVKEKGEEEERVSPAPMFSQPESTKPPRGAEDEDNAMVHIKRKLGSTRKGQRRMHVSEGQLVGEEGPPGGVMEESEEKLQETPDELHKIQEVQGERGFSTQGDSQKAEGPLEYVMEESEEKVLETPDELHKIQEVHGERGFTTQGDSEKEEGPLEDVMEESEEKLQETPDELHKIQEVQEERDFSTQEDRQKAEGPLEDVMEESVEKVLETPDELHKIQEVQEERFFSTQENRQKEELDQGLETEVAGQNISPSQGEFVEVQPSPSVKEAGEEEERVAPAPMLSHHQSTEPPRGTEDENNAMVHRKRKLGSTRKGQRRMQILEGQLMGEEGPPGGVMEESEEKLQEAPDELHKVQEVHGERGFSTQGDSQKAEGPLEDVMEKSEEKVLETPDPFHKIQEVQGERGFTIQGNSQKDELDQVLETDVVEVQPSASVKEKGEEEEEEERVIPASMFSQPESTEPPRGAEDEENAMVHRKRKLGSTRKGQRRMHVSEGQLVGEDGPPGGVMEESEEKLQETPDELHKIQEVQGERGFSTQGDSQKAEGPLEDVMEESVEKVLETPDELHKIQEVHGERGFTTQGDSEEEGPLEDVMEESEEKLQETPDELHKIQEVQEERDFSTQEDRQKAEGPLEDVMEESVEKVLETPDELHKIQEVQEERFFSTQENRQKEELDQGLETEVAGQNISPSQGEFVEVQPSPSVKEAGEEEERVAPAPMLSHHQSTEPPRGTEDENNAMVHRKRKLGSTRKGQRRMQILEGQLMGEEGPPGGVMEESEEKLQEAPDELHKVQEVHGERGFSTQGDSQKAEGPLEDVMEKSEEKVLETPDPFHKIQEVQGERGFTIQGNSQKDELDQVLETDVVEVQPSASVKEKGEEEEEEERVIPASMFSQPESTEPPRGAEDEENAMVHRKRKLGSTRKGQRRMHVSEGQLVGEDGPPGGVMEESEEKLQETPDELHKIQEVQGERGFSTQGDSQKAEGPLEDVMEESVEKVLETPDELHKIQEVHGERGFTTQGDSEKEEGPLEDVMEESEEKLQETPDELHKIQEVQEERFFSTQENRQKEELDQGLETEVAGQNISPSQGEFVEVQPSPSVKEAGEEEERVAPAPMLSHHQSTEPPRGTEDENNAMVHRKRKLGSTRKGQRRMQILEGQLMGEEGPPGGVMEESEEKLQEAPDELHKVQEVHGERGFSTQGDSQKAEGPLEDVMEKSEEKVLETPDPFHKIQEVQGERGFTIQGNSQKDELDQVLETDVVEVQPCPSVKEKGEEEERVSPAPMFSQPESTEPPRGTEDEDNAMVHRKRKLGSTRKGHRRMQNPEGRLRGEGPLEGVMEESGENAQETPGDLHKIQEVHGERGFSTQGGCQKLLVDPPVSVGELEQGLGWEGSGFITSKDLPSGLREFLAGQPSASVKEEERVTPAPMLCQPQSTKDKDSTVTDRKRKLGSSRRGPKRLQNLGGRQGGRREGLETTNALRKIQELFQGSDGEGTGIFTRAEMQEVCGDLPLTLEELDQVFDRLDREGSGYITSEDLSAALREFLAAQCRASQREEEESVSPPPLFYQSQGIVLPEEIHDEEKQHFLALMDKLGASNLLEDQSEIWKLWAELRQNEPHLLGNLEEFVAKVTSQIREAREEKEGLELTLQRRIVEHNLEVRQLYEEMEQQISREKERLHRESFKKSRSQGKELKKELDRKTDEVQHLVEVQNELEKSVHTLRIRQHATCSENETLRRTNRELEGQLEGIREQLQEARARLQDMRSSEAHRQQQQQQQAQGERRQDTEHTSGEPERSSGTEVTKTEEAATEQKKTENSQPAEFIRAGSVLGSYIQDDFSAGAPPKDEEPTNTNAMTRRRVISIEEDPLPDLITPTRSKLGQEREVLWEQEGREILRAQTAPDHLYNVLLVGDSSVGKTSFIKRLKDGEFRSDHCATVGLDSCIHTLLIGDRRFVLQLWDTAGQERYHSITKQVFRKADGVVVMYDITSAQSFTAVRYWLTCIQEGAGDEVVVVLLANKSDSNVRRAVPTHEGEQLAQENRILFHECSAASGYNVTESMINLARQLKEQEEGLTGSDSEKKRVELQETQPKKKSGCC